MKAITLDYKDWKIIKLLKEDARMSIRKIAKRTGIRPSTVYQRLNKLVASKTIEKFTIQLNPEATGENLVVFMLVSGALDKYLDEEILGHRNIAEVYGITGEYDLLLKLKFANLKEFNKFIIEFRDKYNKSINKTVTMVQTVILRNC